MSTSEREAVARPHMRDGGYASRSRVPPLLQAKYPFVGCLFCGQCKGHEPRALMLEKNRSEAT